MNTLQLSARIAAEAAQDYAANPSSEELRQEARAAGMAHYRARRAAEIASGAQSDDEVNEVFAGSRAGEAALRNNPRITLVDLDAVRAAGREAYRRARGR